MGLSNLHKVAHFDPISSFRLPYIFKYSHYRICNRSFGLSLLTSGEFRSYTAAVFVKYFMMHCIYICVYLISLEPSDTASGAAVRLSTIVESV